MIKKKQQPESEDLDEEYGDDEEELETGNGHKKDANIMLLEYLYDTKRKKLPELTDVPLDQVRPMSMMTTYADEVKLLCEDMLTAQSDHFANWWAYHYKSYMKIHRLTDAAEAAKRAVSEMMKDFFPSNGSTQLLSSNWQYYYYQLRRSIGGEHARGAIVLAQDQIAAQQASQQAMSADELLERIQEQ